ncbi:helix-turn-helix domain-containing protein [Methyloceanibacter caenitepidi]|uniref:Transcriptional regulatory protein n=1 Tax=Methyloceanibacter caenitepidi TaxID=1384459 RepID=A0A0A8K441_9HYPH|nr:helix-turn-helix domain-containing protein [Methyloceanibacter caenitepidi]BAQ16759.1 transcriptional regulatory protein [Methyloceanibacter caenitepidi]
MLTPNPAVELSQTQMPPAPPVFPQPRDEGDFHTSSVPLNFARNSEIFAEGESAGYVYKIVSGVVRVSKLLPDGRRQISAFHLPGDMFGFEVDDVHHVSAEAIGPVKVLAYKWQSLLSNTSSSGFVHELLNRTMIGLRQTQDHLLLLGRKNALERLAAFLIEMVRRTGSDRSLQLAMPRHDIADYLGLTLETVSRMFAELKDAGIIKLESARQVSVLDMQKLEAMAT